MGSVFARGFFGQTASAVVTNSGGFVGAYTTAIVAAGANNNVLPAGAGWPGSTASPYGRVDFVGAAGDFNVTGGVGGLDGQIVIFRNATAFNCTLNTLNVGSLAANQFAIDT